MKKQTKEVSNLELRMLGKFAKRDDVIREHKNLTRTINLLAIANSVALMGVMLRMLGVI